MLTRFFSDWQAQRQQQRFHATQAAWWASLHESRPPCWLVTVDATHQPVVSALLDHFWSGLERSRTLPELVQALARWDQQAGAVLAREDVPEGLRREVQAWRKATHPGDADGLEARLNEAYAQRRTILDTERVSHLNRPQRQTPDVATQAQWRQACERFGYTHMGSSAEVDPATWTTLLGTWTRAHATLAHLLDEPDASMGAGRWAAHVAQQAEAGGGFDPVARSIGVSFRPAAALAGGVMDDAPGLDDPSGLEQRWVQALAHERGHALDFWLGERSDAPVHPERGTFTKMGFQAAPDGAAWAFDAEPNAQVRAPLSGRQAPLSTWLNTVTMDLRFTNGCLGMDGNANYLFRPSEIAARFWEGRVRSFEDPPSRTDMTFPNLALTTLEQQALRDGLLRAAGLPLHRGPVPRIEALGARLDQRQASQHGMDEPTPTVAAGTPTRKVRA